MRTCAPMLFTLKPHLRSTLAPSAVFVRSGVKPYIRVSPATINKMLEDSLFTVTSTHISFPISYRCKQNVITSTHSYFICVRITFSSCYIYPLSFVISGGGASVLSFQLVYDHAPQYCLCAISCKRISVMA